MKSLIQKILVEAQEREAFWITVISELGVKNVAEIGVYEGNFAKTLLDNCTAITQYTAVDPWRNLDDWNKPANTDNDTFNAMFKGVLEKLSSHAEKLNILRGTTLEVVKQIQDEEYDFIYIDADHTLRGISIDLISWWPKIKHNGILGGDDFSPNIYQHDVSFEPTFVYPFAIYFAEAVQCTFYKLPFNQFLIHKDQEGFQEIDLSGGRYPNSSVKFLIENKKRKSKFGSLLSRMKPR